MTTRRIDGWTDAEELLLVNTLLDYVRHGKTQIEAFEDVGEKIDRSKAACYFHWNKYLLHRYREEMRIARRERRGQKIEMPVIEKVVMKQKYSPRFKEVNIDTDEMIDFLIVQLVKRGYSPKIHEAEQIADVMFDWLIKKEIIHEEKKPDAPTSDLNKITYY